MQHAVEDAKRAVANRRWIVAAEVGAWLALAGLAAWLRLDRLMTVPAFSDESMEILLALDALAAGRLNSVGVSSFLGGFHTWLLMGLAVVAPGLAEAPRLLSAVLGVGTVLATVGLGRHFGGRLVGWLAGALLATNLAHVAINSRIAWSNCVSPFFVTVGLWLLVDAIVTNRPRRLPLAAVLWALALQTHPSVAALLPGLLLGLALTPRLRGWLRGPWPWVAAAAAALAYGNVLWFNLTTGGKSFAAAQERDYAVRPAADVADFAANLAALAVQFVRGFGSSFAAVNSAAAYPISFTLVALSLLLVVGAVVALRRGQWILPLVLVVSAVAMATVGGEYQPLPHASSRYLAPLWPLSMVLAAAGAHAAVDWLGRRMVRRWRLPGWGRPTVLAALGIALAVPALLSTRAYLDWYGQQPFLGQFNAFALAVVDEAVASAAGEPVYVDTALHQDGSSDAGTMHRSLTMLLRLRRQEPVTVSRTRRQTARALQEALRGPAGLAVLRRDSAAALEREGAQLEVLGEASRVVDPGVGEVRLYRLRLPRTN